MDLVHRGADHVLAIDGGAAGGFHHVVGVGSAAGDVADGDGHFLDGGGHVGGGVALVGRGCRDLAGGGGQTGGGAADVAGLLVDRGQALLHLADQAVEG